MWSDNEEIREGNETDDIIEKLFESFLSNYQKEESVLRNGGNFVFESVNFLSYHIHKTSLKRGKSYIQSSKWLLNERAIINPKNADNKYFQYSTTVAFHPLRILKINPFIDWHNWKDIDFKNWKKTGKSLKETRKLFLPHNIKAINLGYKSKYNRNKRENQVVLLMTTNGKKSKEIDNWHYTALKSIRTDDVFNWPIRSLSRLFNGIRSNNHGDFYCLGFLHSFRADNALKKHERLSNGNDYCHVEMPTKDNNKLKYNHGEKSLKAPFTMYADFRMPTNNITILSK